VAPSHHNQQGIMFGETAAGLACRDDHPLDRIGRQVLAAQAGLFGWRVGGTFSRFAEKDVWGKSITAAIVFVPYRFERSHFA